MMTHNQKVGLLLAMLLSVAPTVTAQAPEGQKWPGFDFEKLRAEMETRTKESVRAVNLAGWSRNRAFVPYLKQLLKEPENLPYGRNPVDFALAMLGDKESLQLYTCFVRSRGAFLEQSALYDVKNIGGWFSIRIFESVLDKDRDKKWKEQFEREFPKKPKGFDYVMVPPSVIAAESLSEIVPDSPRSYPRKGAGPTIAEEIRFWKQWIKANRDSLNKLEPLGEGVDFSGKVCKSAPYRELLPQYLKGSLE